jgi:hypothetical protein
VVRRSFLGTVKGAAVWLCPTEACWKKQVARAMAVTLKGKGEVVRFVPLPRQVEAEQATFEGPAIYVLIGGAAGGSKSRGLREIGHKAALKTPQTRVLLLRRTYKELDQTHLRDVELEAPQMGADAVPSAKVVRYPNGSVMQFGHCETAADAANYLSAEYDLIIFDELVTFEETMFLLIASRARSTKPGVVPKVIAGTNPGGPQSHWVRARFIDHTVDLDQYPDYDPAEWVFIPSKLEDNPYLDQAYERKLLALPAGAAESVSGRRLGYFPRPVLPGVAEEVARLARPQPRDGPEGADASRVSADLERVLSLDWGFVKPGVCGFWALHDGHAVREEEYVFTRTTAFRVGEEIARRIKARGLTRIKYLVYDTAMEIPDNDSGDRPFRRSNAA